MKVNYVHDFNQKTEEEFLNIQNNLKEKITVEPDIFIFDGNGYLHHNNMGIASHAGLFLKKPTMGVGKTYLKIDKVDFIMPEIEVGAYTDIVVKNKVYGRAVRTSKNVKPIFISCGNNIDLNSCYEITMKLISKDSRISIPTRLADLETHLLRQEYRETYY